MARSTWHLDGYGTRAVIKNVRASPRKLNDVAALIRGMSVEYALLQLSFCKRRAALDVRKCLQSAIANAEHNHNLDVDNLYVLSAFVGKSVLMRRFRPRARGKGCKIEKFFSSITVEVAECVE